MEVEQVLHMNGGSGKESYATNCSHQRTVIYLVKPILEETIAELYRELIFPECLKIADLGCSAGPNTFLVVSEIIGIITATCRRLNRSTPPSLQAFLNDLPGNDFNTVFKSLPGFYKKLKEEKGNRKFEECFVAGAPGSFYSRLFPAASLHFFHSSYAIMWISKAPEGLVGETGEALNKENICVAKTSPPRVFKAYLEQFERDFTFFLKCRAKELVPGGRMLLTTMGSIKSDDPLTIWEFVGLKLNEMASEGLIEEAKLESFDLPYYAPTPEEVKKVVEEEGSFSLQMLEAFNMDWDSSIKKEDSRLDKQARAAIVATDIRAVGEPILKSHFGESAMDELFRRFKHGVLDYMEENKCQYINLVISLKRRD